MLTLKLKSEISLSPEQQDVIDLVKAGQNVLVTGSAGTGKSTLLRQLSLQKRGTLPIVASTGIAAVNVQGCTIHSWAGLGMGDKKATVLRDEMEEKRSPTLKRIKNAKILALDEVSMIHGDLFETMDELFRIVRKKNTPFGGIQMVMFGDFLQLPPVSIDIPQKFAFQSDAWVRGSIKPCLLTRVFRQEDAVFSAALNQIRLGNITPEIKALLKSRMNAVDPNPEIEPVTVFTHNRQVDQLNEARLAKIEGKSFKWFAKDYGAERQLKNIKRNCPAPEVLELKIGAQVMCLRNINPEYGIANGSIGIVSDIRKETNLPVVLFNNGEEEEIGKKSWDTVVDGKVVASRTQIPLRLAWAITAHKAQGMTLDKIRVNLSKSFEHGQAYVALSRARTLDGLFIDSYKDGCIKAHPDAVKFYEDAS